MKNTLPLRWHSQREQQHQEGDPGSGDTPPPLLGEDLTFREGWQEALPEEFRATAANFKTLPDFVKSYRHFHQVASGKLDGHIKLPGENATDEERAAFARAIGVPEKPEDYGIAKPEKIDPSLWNDEQVNTFLKDAHAKGLTKEQANWLINYQLEQRSAMAAAEQEEGRKFLEERDKELRGAFGANVEQKMNDAKRIIMTIDPSFNLEDVQYLPAKFVIGLASFAQKIAPDQLVNETQFQNNLKPSDLAIAIVQDKNNPDYAAYHDKSHPNHAAVVAKVLAALK